MTNTNSARGIDPHAIVEELKRCAALTHPEATNLMMMLVLHEARKLREDEILARLDRIEQTLASLKDGRGE